MTMNVKEPSTSYTVEDSGAVLKITEYGPEDEFLLATSLEDPNYTQIPNQILGAWRNGTFIIGQMSDMGEAELKVALALCRQTFGFHRNEAQASLSWFEKATGLSRQGVINGLAQLLKRGLFTKLDTGPHETAKFEKNLGGSQRGRLGVVNVVDQGSQRSRPIKERRKKEGNKECLPPDGDQAHSYREPAPEPPTRQEDHIPESEYVEFDGEGFPARAVPAIVRFIKDYGGRKLAPTYERRLLSPIQQLDRYPSPAHLFDTEPLFKEWVREAIDWANGSKDGEKKPASSLVSAIRNIERDGNGWHIFKEKHAKKEEPLPDASPRTLPPAPEPYISDEQAAEDAAYIQDRINRKLI